MKRSNNKRKPEEILKQIDPANLKKFIIEYGAKHPEFMEKFVANFSAQKTSAGKKDYTGTIKKAFSSNTVKSDYGYYDYVGLGFDSVDVAADLKPLLDKIEYFIKHKNYDEAVLICRTLIETIPGEWDPDSDYDGDVQVVYDAAIDKLQEMLKQKLLSPVQKKTLFDWYCKEHKKELHRDVGLNTDLKALEEFFADTPEMLQQNIKNIDERFKNAINDYDSQRAVIDKISLLQNAGLMAEVEVVIGEYQAFPGVRQLRVEKLVHEKKYEQAIGVINDGIKIAATNNYSGAVADWKDKLLDIYRLQKDTEKIIATAEDLFITGHDSRKYYPILKKHIAKAQWPFVLQHLLAGTEGSGWNDHDDFKAEILIEHKMWDRLLALCKKANVESMEKYEKYLKPHYAKEILDAYVSYVEKQALLTDKHAYVNVARVLKKMKHYEGGKAVVDKLLLKYRELYKKRKNMMEVLKGV